MLRSNRISFLLSVCGVMVVVCNAAPVSAQQINVYATMRSLANRYEKAQAEEREQIVEMCRQQLAAAETAIESSQTQRKSLMSELETARSQVDSARKQETAAKKRLQSARAELQETETAICDRQAADSEYARAQKELTQARDDLDQVILATLGLPPRKTPVEERDRQTERARFTSAQKAKLRASTGYAAANERVSAASSRFSRLKTDLLASDPDYKSATENLAVAEQAIAEAAAGAKAAGLELSRVRKELKSCDATLVSARDAVNECTEFLANMGAPLQSNRKKK